MLLRRFASLSNSQPAFEYCKDMVQRLDPVAYYHTYFLPKPSHQYYYAIQALRIELFKSKETTTETSLVAGKLNWWLDNLNQIWDRSNPPQEMVSIALYDTQKTIPLNKIHFERMIRGRLEIRDLISWMSFDRYIDDNYSMVNYILLEMFDQRTEDDFKAATFAGRAYGIADVLRRTAYFLQTGRNFFPQPLLQAHGLSDRIAIDDLDNNVRNVPEEFYDAVLELASYGRKNLEMCRELLPGLNKNTHLLFLPTTEAAMYYDLLEKSNFGILDSKHAKIPSWKLLYTMFQNSRHKTL